MRQARRSKYLDTQMQIGLVVCTIEDLPTDSSLGSAAVTWSSKKQPTVALSSTEARYSGAAMVACEVVWLQKLFCDLDV